MKYIFRIVRVLIGITLLLITGCSNTHEITEIKPKVIHPPVFQDSLNVVEKTDSVITGIDIKVSSGNGIVNNDTITLVKYYPKSEKFYVRVKPDSIVIWDTLKTFQTIEKKVETPFLSKAGLVFAGIITGAIILLLIRIKIFK